MKNPTTSFGKHCGRDASCNTLSGSDQSFAARPAAGPACRIPAVAGRASVRRPAVGRALLGLAFAGSVGRVDSVGLAGCSDWDYSLEVPHWLSIIPTDLATIAFITTQYTKRIYGTHAPQFVHRGFFGARGGSGCLNSISASISGASARVRLPSQSGSTLKQARSGVAASRALNQERSR